MPRIAHSSLSPNFFVSSVPDAMGCPRAWVSGSV
jgi:hypothetical protein